ncbi:MAG TPA: site-2 protease family protein [Nitrospiraceae bacterium]|nr:site-2 protease family protein [Nitrospiraceae bacterium]
MQGPDWQIGRIYGIPIRIHVSWLVIFWFVTWSLATGYLPDALPGLSSPRYWAMGAMAALLLFASVLLHELGHSYVALKYRIPIGQITLFIFGGVAQMRKEPPSPRAEFLIAIAGPMVSLVIAAMCLGLVTLAETSSGADAFRGLIALGAVLGAVNTNLGLFNLLPGFPLDGGRVLRAGLWAWKKDFYRATSQAATVGLAFGLLFGVIGAALIAGALTGTVSGHLASSGGWIILLGIFLFAAARGSRRQAAMRSSLAAMPVRDLMVHPVVSLTPEATVEEAVNRYFLPYGYSEFPVAQENRLLGIVTVADIQAVPVSRWASTRVEETMRSIDDQVTVGPDMSTMHAVDRMIQQDVERLIVVENGLVVGLISRESIVRLAGQLQA